MGQNVQRPVFLVLLLNHPHIAYVFNVFVSFCRTQVVKFDLLALAVSHCWLKSRGSQLLSLSLSSNPEDLD